MRTSSGLRAIISSAVFSDFPGVSKAVGNRRANIEKIKREYGIDLRIKGSGKLKKREVICECC